MIGRRVSYIPFLVIVATIATATVTVSSECQASQNVIERFIASHCDSTCNPNTTNKDRQVVKIIKRHTYTFSFAPEEAPVHQALAATNAPEDIRSKILCRNRILLE
jgi:hypothetical protein